MGVQWYGRGAPSRGRQSPPGLSQIRGTALRREARAGSRPRRNQIQVGRERPAVRRSEHVVLQHVAPRVVPVVRDLPRRVEPHQIWGAIGPERRLQAFAGGMAVGARGALLVEHLDEAVHLPASHVPLRRLLPVRAADVVEAQVVVRPATMARPGVRDTAGELTLRVARQPPRAREGPEVVIERPVLLHDEDQVVDVADPRSGIDPRRDSFLGRGHHRHRSGGGGAQRRHQAQRQEYSKRTLHRAGCYRSGGTNASLDATLVP